MIVNLVLFGVLCIQMYFLHYTRRVKLEHTAALQERDAVVKEHRAAYKRCQKELHACCIRLEESERLVCKLESDNTNLQKSQSTLQGYLDGSQSKLSELRRDLREVRTAKESVIRELDRTRADWDLERATLKPVFEGHKEEMEGMRDEVKRMHDVLERAHGRFDHLQQRFDALHESKKLALETLQNELNRVQGEVQRARSDAAQARSDAAQARSDEAQARSDEAQARSDEAQARSDEAQARLDEAQARSYEAQARSDEAQARSDEAQARSELRLTRDRLRRVRTDTVRFTHNRIRRDRTESNSVRDNLGLTRAELSSVRNDLVETRAELRRVCDTVSCPICMEPYVANGDRVPVILPLCFHTFCRRCLSEVLARTSVGGRYDCPICREHCWTDPVRLRLNYGLVAVVNGVAGNRRQPL
jgi:chromosome segregation ATPase